ncbi:MAG: hypothetical protein ACLTSZ_15000 [Lachnospiraceae bacterium]
MRYKKEDRPFMEKYSLQGGAPADRECPLTVPRVRKGMQGE